MLTKRPDIVIALPPRRTRRKAKAAAIAKASVIVEARNPRKIKPKPAPATRIVGSSMPDRDEQQRRGEAADRLFQEIVRAVNAPDQLAPGQLPPGQLAPVSRSAAAG